MYFYPVNDVDELTYGLSRLKIGPCVFRASRLRSYSSFKFLQLNKLLCDVCVTSLVILGLYQFLRLSQDAVYSPNCAAGRLTCLSAR